MANGPEVDRDRRKALLVGREDEVGVAESLLFRHDPIGINFGDNADEYRPEAETITLRRAEATSLAVVRTVVHQEFTRWFDTTGPGSAYEDVARDLYCFWKREFMPSRSALVGEGELLRIWSPGRGDRFLNSDEIGVEWCGRDGHPSSYVFVVGRRSEGDSTIALTFAAHGSIGSSARAFERVSGMLNELLQNHHGVHDVWPMWRAISSS